MSAPEQRNAPRVAHPFMVRYRGEGGRSWLMSPLHDLSEGGVRFVSERPFEVGVRLELQLVLPAAPAPMGVQGRVAWSQPWPMGLVELGVQFEALDGTAQQLLRGAVAHFAERTKPS